MGQSKRELFLDRVLAAAEPVFERVVAVERDGGRPSTVRTIFESPHDGEAPAFGVLRALEDADGPSFIIATDYPMITAGVLADLRRRFERSHASMLVPVWSGQPQLLCAGYRHCIEPMLRARLAMGKLDLRGLVDETEVEFVDEGTLRASFAGEPLMNVNTPEEWAEAQRLR